MSSTEEKRRAIELEEERDRMIAYYRHDARERLAALRADVRKLDRVVTNLGDGPGNLYDVDFAEGGGAEVYHAARTQIDVALAAIANTVGED